MSSYPDWTSPDGYRCLVWISTAVITAVVAVRLAVRGKMRNLGADDLFMAIAAVLLIVQSALAQAGVDNPEDSVEQEIQAVSETVYGSLSVLLALVAAKTSVGLTLLRILGPASRYRRWFVVATLGVLYVTTYLQIPSQLIPICIPGNPPTAATFCLDKNSATGIVILNAVVAVFVDLTFSVVPVSFAIRLNASVKKRVLVGLLLGMGWIAGIFTLTRLILGEKEPEYVEGEPFFQPLTTVLETSLVVICGCIGAIAPLFKSGGFKKIFSSRRTSTAQHLPASDLEKGTPHESERKQPVTDSARSDTTLLSDADKSSRQNSEGDMLQSIQVDPRLSVRYFSESDI